ncbi:MAG: RdgB/HAM1 family non-canonical purine NTP pyrophosphatase [Bacteroidetes bacterium]|nr:RdgB/HAM1 family non-canonical purine NTP pyrophosphatase [Bacteroidota bacterium]MBS1541596.1 RdgB/HAM1 family non-canonical purine NTP pyrophosphatase [Bacteroidota bacterium]
MEICFATNNKNKLHEVKALLGNEFHILSLAEIGCHEELPETTGTIAGNSRQKAEYVFSRYGITCFADDSGLQVNALQGAPGVDSAFYAGPQKNDQDNVALLLRNMQHVADRSANFITIITLVKGTNDVSQFEGILNGEITRQTCGTNGFGYDPVFRPAGLSINLAEMSREEKNKISHRAKAVEKLVRFLIGHQTNQ